MKLRVLPPQAAGGRDPDIVVRNASESKGGVIEKYIKVRAAGQAACRWSGLPGV
jgi:hypothetical protein